VVEGLALRNHSNRPQKRRQVLTPARLNALKDKKRYIETSSYLIKKRFFYFGGFYED